MSLLPLSAPRLSPILRQPLALAPRRRGGAESLPLAHLRRCLRILGHDIPAPELLAAPHVINPFAPPAAVPGIRHFHRSNTWHTFFQLSNEITFPHRHLRTRSRKHSTRFLDRTFRGAFNGSRRALPRPGPQVELWVLGPSRNQNLVKPRTALGIGLAPRPASFGWEQVQLFTVATCCVSWRCVRAKSIK